MRQRKAPRKPRQLGSTILIAGAAALVPWIAYLSLTLPTTYDAANWNLAWIGFDVLVLVLLAGTALLVRHQHPAASLTAFATGVLLLADAWFDQTTSTGADHTWALVTALAVELPLAALLIIGAARTQARLVRTDPVSDSGRAVEVSVGSGSPV